MADEDQTRRWKVKYDRAEGPCILPYAECVYRKEQGTCVVWDSCPQESDAGCHRLGKKRIERHFKRAWERDGLLDPRLEKMIEDREFQIRVDLGYYDW